MNKINLNYLPEGGTGHMIPNDEVLLFWKNVKEKIDFKKFMEIGFNAGHSSSILLTLFPDIQLTSYDICMFSITKNNAKIVKNKFGDRFSFIESDSLKIKPEDINGKYDILFIDGSHELEYIENDLNLFFNSDIPFVVIDDLQNKNVKETFKKYSSKLDVLVTGRYKASTGVDIPIRCCGKLA